MRSPNKKKFFKAFLTIFFSVNFVFAQTTTPNNSNSVYSNTTIQSKATELCTKYTAYNNVYGEPTIGGGGGSVPVDFNDLKQVLVFIGKNTGLTANETRQTNYFKYCVEYFNMAAASAKITNQAAKELKTIADKCYGDEKCLLARLYKKDFEAEVNRAKGNKLYGNEIQKMISSINNPKPSAESTYPYELMDFCNKEFDKGRMRPECILVPKSYEVIKESYQAARDRIEVNQASLATEFANGKGVVGSRRCLKTIDGSDPSELSWPDKKCVDWKISPAIENEEVLKQIISLPFTQAFSPSAVLGSDGVINNIGDRVRAGNLLDPDISSNFGSVTGGGSNPLTSGVGSVGTGNLKDVEANYKKLIANIDAVTNLLEAGRLFYASTTSPCAKNLSVQVRALSLSKITTSKTSFENYKKSLAEQWEKALKTPNENHSDLIVKINFDLKDKHNQKEIDDVLALVQAYLKNCLTKTS